MLQHVKNVLVLYLVCASSIVARASAAEVEGNEFIESSPAAWVGSVIAAVAGLTLGSLTVAVLAFNPGEPNRRRAKSRHSKQGDDGCACCH
ncbi:membrane-associated protein, putative [Bodo saltans]|uniref:Membrane-associated protein, putative n=1 Tax=Bodo saltans TaxID=75058 RepID=A0A0S4IXA0_BODSA|nr:membrane-associated protein, putative [Bodo saltans]|eukprot:CUF50941.1 membrane-associated protein, putative [Bodo saltans]